MVSKYHEPPRTLAAVTLAGAPLAGATLVEQPWCGQPWRLAGQTLGNPGRANGGQKLPEPAMKVHFVSTEMDGFGRHYVSGFGFAGRQGGLGGQGDATAAPARATRWKLPNFTLCSIEMR